jgi:hypothetical protein
MEVPQPSLTRQYSVSSEELTNIVNGRCPDYALLSEHKFNLHHWPANHDYFIGNGINISKKTQEIRYILSNRLSKGIETNQLLFCDLDGVLADFNEAAAQLFPDQNNSQLSLKERLNEIPRDEFWSTIRKHPNFFGTLNWMPKGQNLWNAIKHLNPIILTGCPYGSWAPEQKRQWCATNLGPDVPVITCFTKEKPNFCLRNSILIDDQTTIKDEWEKKEGIYYVYTEEKLDDIVKQLNEVLLNTQI